MALGDNIEVDSGSYTPESLRLRRRLAETMLQQGMQTGPVGHWSQGLNRVVQAMLGGWQLGELERKEKGQAEGANAALLGVYDAVTGGGQGGGGGGVAQPSASGEAAQPSLSAGGLSDVSAYLPAIAKIESGGQKDPYRAIGPETRTGDRAYGKYQVMGNNIPSWTKEILGREMTAQEFLADGNAQEAVAAGKFGQYLKKTGSPQDAASMWFTGRPLKDGGGSRAKTPGGQAYGPTGNQYVDQFTRNLGGAQPAGEGVTPAAAMPVNVAPGMRAQIGRLLSNPQTAPIGRAIIQQLATESMSAPKVQEIEMTDQFGRKRSVPATYNRQTRQWEPVTVGQGGGVAPQQMGGGQPPAQIQPSAPAVLPSPAPLQIRTEALPEAAMDGGIGGQGVNRTAKQDMLTPDMLRAMPNQGGQVQMAQPVMSPQQQPAQQPPSRYREMSVNVNTLPKPQEGFVYDLGPNGLPQYDEQFNPKMVSQKEMETRSQLAVKRGETELAKRSEADEQVGGVKAITAGARAIRDQPGFVEALQYGRQVFDVGGQVGGVSAGVNPGQIILDTQRTRDPNNPAWGVLDDIRATQERLKAVVARPLFKGQGSVSNMERQMITDMIGELTRSSNPADYNFRLNSIENMIEDMYSRKEGTSVSAEELPRHLARKQKAARPSRDELATISNETDDARRTQKLNALAAKYNVSGLDMLLHWGDVTYGR